MGKEYNIKSIMEEIEMELISSMKRNLGRHIKEEELKKFDWPQWQSLKIKQFKDYKNSNKEIFNNKTKYLETDIIKRMKEQFKEGASRTNKEAIKSGYFKKEDSKLGGSFFGLNHKKLDALIKSTDNDLKDVKTATLRMANDKYRQIIYKAQIHANTGAGTVKQAIDMATRDFLVNGFNCIEYKNGSRHNIADYSDMAIKTANKRANLMGEGEMRKELGISTVYVSKHSTSCPKCLPWQDRVYEDDVWSGGAEKESKYPLLSTAVSGGLFHPRCRHGVSTFFPGINDEPKPEKEIQPNNTNTEKIQSLQRKQKQYERLVAGSLDNENIENYKNKIIELKEEIANLQKNDIIYDINIEKCKDYNELSKYVKNKWGIDNIDEKVIKEYQYDGVLETFIEMNKVYEDFPQLKGFVKNIEPDSLGIMSTNWAGIKHGQMINSNDKFNSVNIQFGKIYKDYSNVIKAYSLDVSTNFHPKGTTSAVNGIHELGHAIEAYLINKKGYEFEWQKVIAWNDKEISSQIVKEAQNNSKKTILGKGKTNKELKNEISRYSFKDNGETLAEAIADYYGNGDKAAILSIEIVKIVKEMMK